MGFFIGLIFASSVVILIQLLPVELYIADVLFIVSVGQVGAVLLPFGMGAFIQELGTDVFRFTCCSIREGTFILDRRLATMTGDTTSFSP
jgi:hypothetical protein